MKTQIKEYRSKHNMKQDTLAELVGARRETIIHIEKGHAFCKVKKQTFKPMSCLNIC